MCASVALLKRVASSRMTVGVPPSSRSVLSRRIRFTGGSLDERRLGGSVSRGTGCGRRGARSRKRLMLGCFIDEQFEEREVILFFVQSLRVPLDAQEQRESRIFDPLDDSVG